MNIITMEWKEFEEIVSSIVDQIKESKIEISNIYGQPRGGLVFAVRLSHILEKPLILQSCLVDKNTLWVDDVVDTGFTLKCIRSHYFVASLYYNPDALFMPDFYYLIKPKDSYIVFPWEVKGSD